VFTPHNDKAARDFKMWQHLLLWMVGWLVGWLVFNSTFNTKEVISCHNKIKQITVEHCNTFNNQNTLSNSVLATNTKIINSNKPKYSSKTHSKFRKISVEKS